MGFKNSFSHLRVIASIRAKNRKAMKTMMTKANFLLQQRLTSGKSITGKSYQYSQGYANQKNEGGARSPVNWRLHGTLRRSIDFKVESDKNKIRGTLGYRNASFQGVDNKTKLDFLTKKFIGMWALSKSEIKSLMSLFKREFKR